MAEQRVVITAAAGGLSYSVADVAEAESVHHFIEDAVTQLGGIDVLINNASAYLNRGLRE